jgi:histidine triad (HIT) family protein
MTENEACIFCRIVAGKEKASFVAQGTDAVAFLDLHPINEGHTLVVPRKHAVSIGDVDEVAAVAMWSMARRIAAALRLSGLRCEAINLFLADGAAAGQEVFHSHLHVIPRFEGDGLEPSSRRTTARPPNARPSTTSPPASASAFPDRYPSAS